MTFVSDESAGVAVCVGVYAGSDGGAACWCWCWQHWRDVGLRVLALVLMDVGGVHVGVMELGGIAVGGGGLEFSVRWRLCWRNTVM